MDICIIYMYICYTYLMHTSNFAPADPYQRSALRSLVSCEWVRILRAVSLHMTSLIGKITDKHMGPLQNGYRHQLKGCPF